ncbi:MAG: DUF3078 domain-containing protein [Ferruginibacter sp.]
MKSLLCSFFIIALSHTAGAQDKIIRTLQLESGSVSPKVPAPTPDTIKRLWKKGGIYRINLGQGSLSNWAAGGDEFSLTVNSSLNLYATYKKHNFGWDNSLDLVMGFLNTTTLGSRKNDDRIDFVSKQTYTIDKKTSFATLANFRTQFFAGYTYKEKSKTYASNFLSPGYVLTSIGINSKPVKELSFFVSPLTSRWIIVRNDSLASKAAYGVDTGKNIVNQLGSFATINYQKEFLKNLSYKSRLDLFSNYKKNPWNVDVYMTNVLAIKVFKLLSFNWSFDVIYDDDTRIFGENKDSPALQLKSIVGAGLQFKI